MSTLGNAADFGNLLAAKKYAASASNSVRGIWSNGNANPTYYQVMEYVTIATLGNSIDFGDPPHNLSHGGALASSTRYVHLGGANSPSYTNQMYYVQIMTKGNGLDFGDLLEAAQGTGGTSNGHGGLG